MLTIKVNDLKQLYDINDAQWLEETACLLKKHQFQQLDLDNLIEELEDLGRGKKNAVASLLEQIIRHLLLLQYWKIESEHNAAYWQEEVYTFRTQLGRKITTNLGNYLEKEFNSIYQNALGFVKIKTVNSVVFPPDCSYALEKLLDRSWLP